ncbi:hypothetical protein SAMN05421666_1059 [Roseovarius nanhaiticus]|uniref:Hpt domain-containing protein n=2 Tax=Roseovarius nanhaiticus TaxID=573024 RepID=A0A1N7FI42_9RHOB|nr:hypothetical protein SAMN05216208_1077 [Roseovarius nanhaiticus]SIR99954.1 hypothetical protein SAMN05421666_1059 [Roseovarius nanhaiticus]
MNWGETVKDVTMLVQKEVVRLNASRLEELYAQLGEAGAEDVVCRALEELALRLSHTERCYREGRTGDMRKSARSLVAIADQIGMQALSRVAADVTIAADRCDHVAIAATLSRLLRIGDCSLSEVWEMQDLSI